MENTQELHLLDKTEPVDLNIALKQCMEALKEQQRLCVASFYYEEKCYKEISEELNIEIKKVKSFIQNGKRNLKLCMDQNKQVDHD
jgi:RNA polymerase sigma-70 factor (ECF subfamily)